MTARIDRLWPDAAEQLSDDDLIASIDHAGVRFNFISSIDGAATRDGLSGGLGGPADQRLFELLRRVADVVVVGAGTVRAEGYGPLRVSEASQRWRVDHGRTPHPILAIVTGRLGLDPGSEIFTAAPVRPIIFTTENARNAEGIESFADVADVVVEGRERVRPETIVAHLTSKRSLHRILCEGGPSLFGDFIGGEQVDELCVTLSPALEAGQARRIARSDAAHPQDMSLATVLRSGDTLLLRYARSAPST